MKKIILSLTIAAAILTGCKKSDQTHSVEVTMTYIDPISQTFMPDVNAGLYIYKQRGKMFLKLESNREGTLTFEGETTPTNADYSAKANSRGVAVINNLPAGNYNIVIGSNARNVYSYTNKDVNGDLVLSKQFTAANEGTGNDQAW